MRHIDDNRLVRYRTRELHLLGVALLIVCLSFIAFADCFDLCQDNLAGCLAGVNGNPSAEFACQKAFYDCAQQCLLK